MTDMELTLRQKVEKALDQFSKGEIPQYFEFMDWVAENSDCQQSQFLPTDNIDHENFLPAILMEKYLELKALLEVQKNIDLQTYNKYKLTLKFLGAGEDRNLIGTIENHIEYKDNFSIKELKTLNKHQIKHLFFESLKQKNSSLASRLVQLIHLLEENLDPGEIEYLEALFHYTDGNLQEAIRLASEVTDEHIDYNNSSFIILNSLAKLSEPGELINELRIRRATIDVNKLEQLRINLIINIDGEIHSADKEEFEALLKEFLNLYSEITQNKPLEPQSLTFGELRNTIVKIRLEIFQRYSDLLTRNELEHDFFKELLKKDSAQFLAQINEGDPRLANLFTTQVDYREFYDFFINEEFFEATIYPFRFLANGLQTYEEISVYVNVLDTFERHDEKLTLLKEGLEAFKIRFDEVEFNKFLMEYLSSAMICKDKKAEKDAKKRINKSIKGNELAKILESSIKKKTVSRLTRKSELAYHSASWMLDKAKEKNFQWKDAGSISLGFMKVLEIELKNLLIESFLNQQILEQLKQIKLEGKDKRFYKTIDMFIRILKGNEHSALGKYSYLLQFFEKIVVHKSDQTNQILKALFTDSGIQALKNKEISKTISYDVINRYRNPPAHIEHLDLPVAIEASQFVDDTLECYFEWFKFYN